MSVPLTRANAAGYVAMENRTSPLQIGRESQNWRQFDGGLDELRLWNVARSAAEIQAAMNGEVAGPSVGLVAYWRFNEGSGTTVDDTSAGNLIGTLSSAALWRDGGPLAPAAPDTTPPDILNIATSGLDRSWHHRVIRHQRAGDGPRVVHAQRRMPVHGRAECGDGHGTFGDADRPHAGHALSVFGARRGRGWQRGGQHDPDVPDAGGAAGHAAADGDVHESWRGHGVRCGHGERDGARQRGCGRCAVQTGRCEPGCGGDDSAVHHVVADDRVATDGSHTLRAEARDAVGNIGVATVAVTVQNGPVVTTPHYVEFDGAASFMQVADANALSFVSGAVDTPLTLDLWMRPDDLNNRAQLLGGGASRRTRSTGCLRAATRCAWTRGTKARARRCRRTRPRAGGLRSVAGITGGHV